MLAEQVITTHELPSKCGSRVCTTCKRVKANHRFLRVNKTCTVCLKKKRTSRTQRQVSRDIVLRSVVGRTCSSCKTARLKTEFHQNLKTCIPCLLRRRDRSKINNVYTDSCLTVSSDDSSAVSTVDYESDTFEGAPDHFISSAYERRLRLENWLKK